MPRATPLHYLRATLFYAGFYPVTILYSSFCLLVGWALPFRPRFKLFTVLNYFYMIWLRICCGVRFEVSGLENLPRSGAYVVVANHQSEWETLYFQTLVRPQSVVLKQELLKLPFFGWALAMLQPIALDRSQRRGALKQLLTQGRDRLSQQVPVLIFPQGTRVKVGEMGRFNKGGAMLAVDSQVPVVPIVHNAGLYWPGKSFVKFPGTVQVRIGAPLTTVERTVDDVHRESVDWIEQEMREIGA